MYYSRELDTLRRFAVFLIDMFIVGLCINIITTPYSLYLSRELGTMNEALNKLNIALDDYLNGIGSYDTVMNVMQGILKYSLLLLAVTLPVSLIVYFLYFVLLPMKSKSQTLGRMLMHARVERIDGEPLTYKTLCLRELVGTCLFYNILGSFMIFISLIVFLVSKRTLVDHVSKTNLYDINKSMDTNNGYYDRDGNYYTYDNDYNNNNYDNGSYDDNGNYDDNGYDNNDYNNYEDDNYRPDHYDDNYNNNNDNYR